MTWIDVRIYNGIENRNLQAPRAQSRTLATRKRLIPELDLKLFIAGLIGIGTGLGIGRRRIEITCMLGICHLGNKFGHYGTDIGHHRIRIAATLYDDLIHGHCLTGKIVRSSVQISVQSLSLYSYGA